MTTTTSTIVELRPLERLRRDARSGLVNLTRQEIRFLVDTYYSQQDFRIQAAGQLRAATRDPELVPNGTATDEVDPDNIQLPEAHEVILWHFEQMKAHEDEIKRVLDAWTDREPTGVGAWMKSITGIGPVLAAGFLAYIDIRIAQTAGQVWRFAGLDPTNKWQGKTAGRELVKAAFDVENSIPGAIWWLAEATHRHPTDLLRAGGIEPVSRDEVVAAIVNNSNAGLGDVDNVFSRYPLRDDNAIAHACEEFDLHPAAVYTWVYGKKPKLDKEALGKFLAKRPWSGRLKVLAWKLGESFVKVSNNKNDYYGHLYAEKKADYQRRNEAGEYTEQAKAELAAKNYGADTEARKWYERGLLPPAQIHARAKRWAVKLFLAHLFEEMYVRHYGKQPPVPYPIAFMGHTHRIERPNPS